MEAVDKTTVAVGVGDVVQEGEDVVQAGGATGAVRMFAMYVASRVTLPMPAQIDSIIS